MSVSTIIVAAGRGTRLGAAAPKQFLDLGGQPMLERALSPFEATDQVTQIVVVLPAATAANPPAYLVNRGPRVVTAAGGPRRQDSVACGFGLVSPDAEIVLVHDAARPFATRALVDRVIAAARAHGAAVPAIAATDTVKRATPAGHGLVASTLPRNEVFLAQTPQGFTRALLARAVALAAGEAEATDEATLVEREGVPVHLVEGDPDNVKITGEADMARARARLDDGPRIGVGIGYDLHRLVSGRRLVLGGVTIPCEQGLQGHSDGDAVCHALTDAVLGAAGLGDIGTLFPDHEAKWRDADSLDLLRVAVARVRSAGWAVQQVDVVVIAETPRIGPHVAAMRGRLGEALGIEEGRISVKGKTNEGVDGLGRSEAIAVHAVATIGR